MTTEITENMEPLLTFKEAMTYLRVSRSTLNRLLERGDLIGNKVGDAWRFTKTGLDAYVRRDNQERTDAQ